MHRISNDERVDFFLAAETWSGEITNLEPDKCDELRWVPLDQLPENTIPYVRQALENYRNGVWFDSYGWQEAPQPVEPNREGADESLDRCLRIRDFADRVNATITSPSLISKRRAQAKCAGDYTM